jgi:ATP-dependent DNA helicase RecG
MLADLDRERLEEYVRQLRRARLDAPYLNRPFEDVLRQLRIARDVDGVLRPTLAGLLMFGVYPQTFEPQLVITFLHYYGTDEAEKTPRGERFLDNRKFEGSIPDMVEAAVNYVMASIRKSSLIEGLLRRDIPEYPEEAVREAVGNAVAHRDYSPYVRGSYIQLRLFADRLEVQSPGGLYGNVTEETLEEEQSTRNRVLMRLMEDAHLVENRGSGIRAMIDAMRRLNLEPPRFQDRRASFLVTFRSHTLMGPEAIAWLNRFADRPLTDRQRLALVYLRYNEQLTNSDYQRLNHVDPVTASRELRGLVQSGLVEQHSTRRWAYYTLSSAAKTETGPVPLSDEERIIAYLREHGSINNAECRDLLGADARRVNYVLQKMLAEGVLQQQGERRWARYALTS